MAGKKAENFYAIIPSEDGTQPSCLEMLELGTSARPIVPVAEALTSSATPTDVALYSRSSFRDIVCSLAVAAAVTIASKTVFAVLKIHGVSMEPTIKEGDIVLTSRSANFAKGDIIAFHSNSKVLLKRVIAFPGDWVDISQDGTVSVNGEALAEDYASNLSLGHANVTFPYQVPENNYFVLGDHRNVSIDSRSSAVGTVQKEQILGKVLLRVWPLDHLGVKG